MDIQLDLSLDCANNVTLYPAFSNTFARRNQSCLRSG